MPRARRRSSQFTVVKKEDDSTAIVSFVSEDGGSADEDEDGLPRPSRVWSEGEEGADGEEMDDDIAILKLMAERREKVCAHACKRFATVDSGQVQAFRNC